MKTMKRGPDWRLAALGLACALWARPGAASGLQVAPISLSLRAEQNADGLWLSNTGNAPIHAQVRVFHWTQDNGHDQLTATHDLAISPPMIRLAPGQRQLVRVIRSVAAPRGREDAFRVLIDELPVSDNGREDAGVQFVLSYSVPVFLVPSGDVAPEPALDARLVSDGKQSRLVVTNSSDRHARIAHLTFVDAAGKRSVLTPGLLGYALPGQRMQWTLQAPPGLFARGGSLTARINDETAERTLAPGNADR